MPPLSALAATTFDPVAALIVIVAAALYGAGVTAVRRRGGAWPARRTVAFAVLGLGSYAAVSFGFLGALSPVLRWAFAVRISLLLLVVPALVALGRPVPLMRQALGDRGRRRLEAVLATRAVRLLGTAAVAAIIPLGVFGLLLTPLAAARVSAVGEGVVSSVLPLVGLIATIALGEDRTNRTGAFFTAEFLIAFVELVVDAIPGIVMRLSTTVLDGIPHVTAAALWIPSPLRDQQLAGDLLWLVAECGDIPALVLLFLRWQRSDRREARSFDDLSEEEYAAMAMQHLERCGDS